MTAVFVKQSNVNFLYAVIFVSVNKLHVCGNIKPQTVLTVRLVRNHSVSAKGCRRRTVLRAA